VTGGASLAVTIKAAQREIERARHIKYTPVVLWQGVEESLSLYLERMERVRHRLTPSVRLIAVCEPDLSLYQPPEPLPAPNFGRGITACLMPRVYLDVLNPKVPARYRVGYSGRGATKSWTFTRGLILRALTRPELILSAREFMNSIADSVHRVLCDQIDMLELGAYFKPQLTSIEGTNGSEFIFSGIRNNVQKIKSTEGVTIAFLEEAEATSSDSWQVIIPTIRKAGSEIWVIFNPNQSTDATYDRMITNPPPRALVKKSSWRDNPWLSADAIAEKDYLQRVDPDAYLHVWEGECNIAGDAQVFRGKFKIEAFEPPVAPMPLWDGPYHGADWGFAVDPSVLVKLWIDGNRLLIEYEAYKVGCDIDKTPALFDTVPKARDYVIRADSARPETISYMQQNGYPKLISVVKRKDAIEDGIAFLRSFEIIIIHPRCVHAAQEFHLYSYKRDRISGDILPDLEERHDHVADACRYATADVMYQRMLRALRSRRVPFSMAR
jgi:phage terminase large subunit